MDFKQQRVVITGGGRGIGAAIAEALTAEGASVVVAARSRGDIEAVAGALRDAGHQAWAVPCDVTDPVEVEALKHRAMERLGGVDVLVNNAGIGHSAPLKAMTLEDWNRIFAVNVTGTFLCTKAFLPGMVEHGWGRVINVASVAGKMGAPYISAYSASKHAVIGFTRSIAAEVAQAGVTVNAVCPGFVETEMVSESVERIVRKTGMSTDDARQNLERNSPQNRVFEATEVAYQVLCLCDPRARGVNGQAVVLDGGAVQS
ncbi:MAG: SDR family NAD(P)-dependent oxidoreductase [Acidobacteriota bacterium]